MSVEAQPAASKPAAANGGMSSLTLVGIIGGVAAGGAAVALAAGQSGPSNSLTTTPTTPLTSVTTPTPPVTTPNSAPTISSATVKPNIALVGTELAFQVQASDSDNDRLTYLWEFPDGTTSDEPTFTRVIQHAGVYTIRVNVSDGKLSTTSELSLNLQTVTGDWAPFSTLGTHLPRVDRRFSGVGITFSTLRWFVR
jgi:hypothetical protein